MTLIQLNLNYQRRMSNDEIEQLAEIWGKSLKDISPDIIEAAAIVHMSQSEYYPTIKEIKECCSQVWNERLRRLPKLPEPEGVPLTKEETKAAADKARKIIRGVF